MGETIKASRLKPYFQSLSDDADISFGNQSYNRIKQRGDNLYVVELYPTVYYDEKKKKWIANQDAPPPESDE